MPITFSLDTPATEPCGEATDAISATETSPKDVTVSEATKGAYVRYHAHNPVSTQGHMHVHLHSIVGPAVLTVDRRSPDENGRRTTKGAST